MRAFNSLEAFGSFLRALIPDVQEAAQHALHDGARAIQHNAEARIGHYDGNDWPQLAAVTQEERVDLGFAPNDPLLRTGDLRASITSEVRLNEAVVGVPDLIVGAGTKADPVRNIGDIAADQELGTSKGIPPRPFLAPAARACERQISGAVGTAAGEALAGLPYSYHAEGGVDLSVPF